MPLIPAANSGIVANAFLAMEVTAPSSLADASPAASLARITYEQALRTVLEMHDWAFASCLARLPPAVLAADQIADPDFPTVHVLPADCVMLRDVPDKDRRWRMDNLFLRSDAAGSLVIRYTRLIDNEAQMTQAARDVVSLTMAERMAPLLAGSNAKADRLSQRLADAMYVATRQNDRTASAARTDDDDTIDWRWEALR